MMARDRFLGFFENLRERVGPGYKPYKGLETGLLERAFEEVLRSRFRGVDFVAYIVHRLSWLQALPNLNHRTTLGFVQAALEDAKLPVPFLSSGTGEPAYLESTEEWMRASKRMMADREMWLDGSDAWKELEDAHLELTRKWISRGAQSGSFTNFGPHFLRNFLSCSVK